MIPAKVVNPPDSEQTLHRGRAPTPGLAPRPFERKRDKESVFFLLLVVVAVVGTQLQLCAPALLPPRGSAIGIAIGIVICSPTGMAPARSKTQKLMMNRSGRGLRGSEGTTTGKCRFVLCHSVSGETGRESEQDETESEREEERGRERKGQKGRQTESGREERGREGEAWRNHAPSLSARHVEERFSLYRC